MTCQFNPFNPDAPKAFDAIVGRGLAGASRWLEKTIGNPEWARRFDAMDRRFMPERDLPLIAYETQWSLLDLALTGGGYPKLAAALRNRDLGGLKNDARLVFEKLAHSQAMLVQVTDANENLPYYTVQNVFNPEQEYLYVDFGDQEPLERGALMFGRFLVHQNCIYVIPGVFVGSAPVLGLITDAITEFLDEEPDAAHLAMQGSLPEIWNLCTAIQDEYDGIGLGDDSFSQGSMPDDPCRVSFQLDADKEDAVIALRRHPFFSEIDPPDFGFDPLGETVFDVHVTPASGHPIQALDDEEEEEDEVDVEEEFNLPDDENGAVRVGSVSVSVDTLSISALNPVEMELLKALVLQLVACSET